MSEEHSSRPGRERAQVPLVLAGKVAGAELKECTCWAWTGYFHGRPEYRMGKVRAGAPLVLAGKVAGAELKECTCWAWTG